MFKDYESKPVVRRAYEIKEGDTIVNVGANTSTVQVDSNLITFKHHEPVEVGDFIVYLNGEDIYHCNRSVFLERNVVPERE